MRWFQSSDQPNDPRIRNRWCGYSPNDLPGKPNRDDDFLWHLCLCPIVVVQIRRKRVSRSKKTFPFLLLAGSWSVRFRLVRATARQFAVRVPLGGEDNRLKLLLLHCLQKKREKRRKSYEISLNSSIDLGAWLERCWGVAIRKRVTKLKLRNLQHMKRVHPTSRIHAAHKKVFWKLIAFGLSYLNTLKLLTPLWP